jgi:PadR family transcriptional regulator, regulatory protein PadR
MDSKLIAGTVEMLILQVLCPAESYGYQITQDVLARSQGYFELKEGSLYPALHRMERQDLLESYWVDADSGRRRKYYRITAAGKKVLDEKLEEWHRFAMGVNGVLGAQAHGVA